MIDLKVEGIIYVLYIKDQRIEHFASVEDAAKYAKKHYPSVDMLIKPIVYFKYKEEKK